MIFRSLIPKKSSYMFTLFPTKKESLIKFWFGKVTSSALHHCLGRPPNPHLVSDRHIMNGRCHTHKWGTHSHMDDIMIPQNQSSMYQFCINLSLLGRQGMAICCPCLQMRVFWGCSLLLKSKDKLKDKNWINDFTSMSL